MLTYDVRPEAAAAAMEHFPAHRQRLDEFRDRGELLFVGLLRDPEPIGAMGVFTTREAADQFVAGDPFILHDVVRSHRIVEWDEAYHRA